MNNIEEKFYKTFGIEKRCIRPKDCVRKGICRGAVACDFYTYPEITSDILLQLICIFNSKCYWEDDIYIVPKIVDNSLDSLKEYTLMQLINYKEYTLKPYWEELKTQVQSLFKGGE